MSNETLNNFSRGVHWFLQVIIAGLVSVVTYFVVDIHSDFKEVRDKVEAHEASIKVLNYITQNSK